MAILEFELKDSNGINTDIGDEIIVYYPEIEIWQHPYTGDEIEFYRPRTKARCKILLPPSKGLRLKILEIIKVYGDDDFKNDSSYYELIVGQQTDFRRTVWEWYKIV